MVLYVVVLHSLIVMWKMGYNQRCIPDMKQAFIKMIEKKA